MMMWRRQFLQMTAGIIVAPLLKSWWSVQDLELPFEASQRTQQKFYELLDLARWKQWDRLPIGQCMGEIGRSLLGTPYVGGTLEGPNEVCRVNLLAVDCVTFFEYVLCFARILKQGKETFADFVREIAFVRYRNGQLDGYASRLHYMTDWILDNIAKGVVKDQTANLGGRPFRPQLFFMSTHPEQYPQLKGNPALIAKIRRIEQQLNTQTMWMIPKSRVAAIEPQLQTGDIVAFVSNRVGLDYGHTGIIYHQDGQAYLLHASLRAKKVFMDDTVARYLQSVGRFTGITVVRPLEVRKS